MRPAYTAALRIARAGEDADPVVPAPPGLRPFLHFARFPKRAQAAARRALESDDEFRARVAGATSEDEIGRAPWIFLTRPPGWEDELAVLQESARRLGDEQAARRDQRDTEKALERLEAAVRRADAEARAARQESAGAAAALTQERRARQRAVEGAADLERRLRAAGAELERANAAIDQATAELARLRTENAALADEVARLGQQATGGDHPPQPNPAIAVVSDAAASARALATALASAVRLLSDPAHAPPTAGEGGEAVARRKAEKPGPAAAHPPAATGGAADTARRPQALPPAVLEDSPEAAEYLLRRPRVLVLVDGYNVSHAGWPELPIAEQRVRLADALAELSARTGADVHVIYDGSDVAVTPAVANVSKSVKVAFSPAGTEADDVIVQAVSEAPHARPVVVASSDRQLGARARQRGANVVSSRQLLAVMRR